MELEGTFPTWKIVWNSLKLKSAGEVAGTC